MKHLESKIQIAAVTWFRLQYPNILISSFPNGGVRSKAMGGIMVAEGLTKGMPDLVILMPSKTHHSLFIEFKTEKGILSPHQKEVAKILSKNGFKVVVCRSVAEFMDEVIKYFAS